VFSDEAWQALYLVTQRQPPPDEPPSLDTMVRMVATLGGFLNRKHDAFPGPQTLWIGLGPPTSCSRWGRSAASERVMSHGMRPYREDVLDLYLLIGIRFDRKPTVGYSYTTMKNRTMV
jgi:hypothetical protein